MSELRDLLTTVIAERRPTFGDTVEHTRTQTSFIAEIEPIQDIEANALLGRDARESVIFHIADRSVSAKVQQNDIFKALGEQFKVLRRSDNPGSPQADFGCMKLTDQDDDRTA